MRTRRGLGMMALSAVLLLGLWACGGGSESGKPDGDQSGDNDGPKSCSTSAECDSLEICGDDGFCHVYVEPDGDELEAEGGKALDGIAEKIAERIAASGGKVDYVEILDAENLEQVSASTNTVLIAVAAFFGATRLIDNALINLN